LLGYPSPVLSGIDSLDALIGGGVKMGVSNPCNQIGIFLKYLYAEIDPKILRSLSLNLPVYSIQSFLMVALVQSEYY